MRLGLKLTASGHRRLREPPALSLNGTVSLWRYLNDEPDSSGCRKGSVTSLNWAGRAGKASPDSTDK